MGVPKAIGLDIPNFVNDVLRVPKCVPRWGSAPKLCLMGSEMKLWTIHALMGLLEVIGLDVSNLMKDVPNLMKDIPNFVKDVPRVPKCILRWGSVPNHFLMGF